METKKKGETGRCYIDVDIHPGRRRKVRRPKLPEGPPVTMKVEHVGILPPRQALLPTSANNCACVPLLIVTRGASCASHENNPACDAYFERSVCRFLHMDDRSIPGGQGVLISANAGIGLDTQDVGGLLHVSSSWARSFQTTKNPKIQ